MLACWDGSFASSQEQHTRACEHIIAEPAILPQNESRLSQVMISFFVVPRFRVQGLCRV